MKIFLWFEILDCGEFQGEELYCPYNKPKKGKNGRLPISSYYYQACVLAGEGKPIRWDRPNTDLFRGKRFFAKVRTVTTGSNKEPRPEALYYSIIDRLIKLLTDSEKQ